MTEKSFPAKPPKPLSFKLKFFFGIGDMGFSLMTNIETFYFQFFLTNIAAFSTQVLWIVTTVVSVVDASLSWIYGGILNIIKPRKIGRYRPYLVLIPWIVPILFAFQFLKISENVGLSAFIITAAAIISHIVWNLPYAANMAMISIAGQTSQGKAVLSSSRATWNNISSILFSYAGLPLITLLSSMSFLGEKVEVVNKATQAVTVYRTGAFAAVTFILGVVMALTYWVHYIITKGYEMPEDAAKPKESKTKASFGSMAKALFANSHLLFLIVADLAKWIVKFVVAGSAIYYWTYVAGNASIQTNYVLISSICAVIGAYSARFFTKLFSNKMAIIYAYILMAAAMIIAYFAYSQVTLVFILMCVGQFGYGICYAVAPALYADAAVYADWKTKKSNVGWIMGLQTLPLKIGVILKAIVIAAVLTAINFSKDMAVTEGTKQGLTASFALIPGLFLVLGAVLLIFGYRLTKEKVEKYQAELDAQK
jgi:GPH family glycoside/pentoside/hexuronide:cation symporter